MNSNSNSFHKYNANIDQLVTYDDDFDDMVSRDNLIVYMYYDYFTCY